jgi:hypothetical protein
MKVAGRVYDEEEEEEDWWVMCRLICLQCESQALSPPPHKLMTIVAPLPPTALKRSAHKRHHSKQINHLTPKRLAADLDLDWSPYYMRTKVSELYEELVDEYGEPNQVASHDINYVL